MRHWLAEIRRRNVHRALIGYLAAAWLVAQVGGLLSEAFAWPTWVLRAVVVALLLGIPAVAVVAWFFRITLSGLVREEVASSADGSRPGVDQSFGAQGEAAAESVGRAPKTLAVLPFRPIVEAGRDEALEFGMTDTLISRLSGVADVIVRPLSSVRRYATLEQDPIAAGRELRVESVLDGSVQKSGDRLRATARLLMVSDGRQLWSGRFDEDYVDIFTVQDSIADRVAAALALELTEADRRRLGRRATNDTVAYDLFLNGRYYWNRRASPTDLARALEFYTKAAERDPHFALAHAGRADALAVQAAFGVRAPADLCPLALAAAERALAIHAGLAEAHATRGHIRLNFQHDWQASLDDYDEAIRRDPRYATAHMWRGFRLLLVGRSDEGLGELQVARELEPDSIPLSVNRARGLYWMRRYDEADTQLARVLEIEPRNGLARALLASVRTQRGRHDDALEMLSQMAANAPGSAALRGVALAAAGRRGEARDELTRLIEQRSQDYVSAYDVAGVCAALGDLDAAFLWLGRSVAERSWLVTTLRVDPVMDGLRADTRYAELEKGIRMPTR